MNAIARYLHRFTSYVDEFVYGANDGIITTFAVVSGAAGAGLGHTATIILGCANLVADGFSMGASSFLSIRTEADVDRAHGRAISENEKRALSRSLATFFGFLVAGLLPLLPFLFGSVTAGREFLISAWSAGIAFFVVGGLRSLVTRRSFMLSGLEMFVVGGIASALAYGVGFVIEWSMRT
jgi:VIT1/CCC1 family predicted Fe2+/Mn2+ transporter